MHATRSRQSPALFPSHFVWRSRLTHCTNSRLFSSIPSLSLCVESKLGLHGFTIRASGLATIQFGRCRVHCVLGDHRKWTSVVYLLYAPRVNKRIKNNKCCLLWFVCSTTLSGCERCFLCVAILQQPFGATWLRQ